MTKTARKQLDNYIKNDDYESIFEAMIMFSITQEWEMHLKYQRAYFYYCENGKYGDEAAALYAQYA